jgi:uncharacterized membrane protein
MSSTPRPATISLGSAPHGAVAFVATAATFLLLDAAWLTTMASRLYRPAIGHIMRPDFDVLAAAAFYAIYLAGVLFFAVRQAADARSALARGAFFGLVCYATYDLTNQATVAGWPWHVTAIDLCWGAFVTGTSAWAGYVAGSAWRR